MRCYPESILWDPASPFIAQCLHPPYSIMAPAKMNAAIIDTDGEVAVRKIDVPKPGPREILVKVSAAAQNPTDCDLSRKFESYYS